MSKLDKIRKNIFKAQESKRNVEDRINQLNTQFIELTSTGNYDKVASVEAQIWKQERLLQRMEKAIKLLKMEAGQIELKESQKKVAKAIREIDETIPGELSLVLRELKHGISSIFAAEDRFRAARTKYNELIGLAKQTDVDIADRLLRPYEDFDWSFGESQLVLWLGETMGILKDPKKYAGLKHKIYSYLDVKGRQLDTLLKATKKRKR